MGAEVTFVVRKERGYRQCLVASAALFGRALNAPGVVFLPDSGADVSV